MCNRLCREQLKPGDVDDKLLARLQDEPPQIALLALELFSNNVPPDCRNRAAFLTSQIKVARQRIANGTGSMLGPGRGASRGSGLAAAMASRRGPGMMVRPPGMVSGVGPEAMMMMGAAGMVGPMPNIMMPHRGPGRQMMSASGVGRARGAGGGTSSGRSSSKPGTNFTEQQEAAGVRIDVRALSLCSECCLQCA
jgi:hypothetical protein